jgi:hypothetical protein
MLVAGESMTVFVNVDLGNPIIDIQNGKTAAFSKLKTSSTVGRDSIARALTWHRRFRFSRPDVEVLEYR